MSLRNVRSLLAIIVVGMFMIITGFLALYPLLTQQQVALNSYVDFFLKTSSVYTGIVGVVVGYYFGRAEDQKQIDSSAPAPKANPTENVDGHEPSRL